MIFFPETKLPPAQEMYVKQTLLKHGYEIVFNPAIPCVTNTATGYKYGLAVAHLEDIIADNINVPLTHPNKPFPLNPERIMITRMETSLIKNEPIIFINIYYPSSSSDPYRKQGRENWIQTVRFFCQEFQNQHVVLFGDFNMQKSSLCNNKKSDERAKSFDKMQQVFVEFEYTNVCESLWKNNVWTRFGKMNGKVFTSRLDYVVVSKKMIDFNYTISPLYDTIEPSISDHVSIECCISKATINKPSIASQKKMTIPIPVLEGAKKVHRCLFLLTTQNQSVCGHTFTSNADLVDHIRRHNEEKNYKCTHEGCESAFVSKTELVRHIRRHVGEKPHKCTHEGCNSAFVSKGELDRHICTHADEKPYKCTYPGCKVGFNDKSRLLPHMRRHTEDKRHKCTHKGCEYASVSKSELNAHMRSHTGEKPYKCQNCDAAFVSKSKLNRHQ